MCLRLADPSLVMPQKHSTSFTPPPPPPFAHPGFLILHIRRPSLLADAVHEIGRHTLRDLYKPIKVFFVNEEGVDAGGVTKEFFQLVVAEVLSASYGLFVPHEGGRAFSFNPAAAPMAQDFFFVGVLVGIALHNGVQLDLKLHHVGHYAPLPPHPLRSPFANARSTFGK
jgi:hypothetical protein